jgi:hypothetical protein
MSSPSSIALTLREGHGVSQCVLTLKYVHFGHCLFPVFSHHLSVREFALDESLSSYTAHTLTVRLLSSQATTTFYDYDEGAPNGGTTRLFFDQ